MRLFALFFPFFFFSLTSKGIAEYSSVPGTSGLFFYSIMAFSILKSRKLTLDFNVHFATDFFFFEPSGNIKHVS